MIHYLVIIFYRMRSDAIKVLLKIEAILPLPNGFGSLYGGTKLTVLGQGFDGSTDIEKVLLNFFQYLFVHI